MRFVVRSVSVEPNVRGQQMRQLHLGAVAGDAFLSDDELPEGVTAPDPVGAIAVLVSRSFAKRFAVGDEFDVIFRERE